MQVIPRHSPQTTNLYRAPTDGEDGDHHNHHPRHSLLPSPALRGAMSSGRHASPEPHQHAEVEAADERQRDYV